MIQHYLEQHYSSWYYCEDVTWAKYFFDFIALPYQQDNQYILHYTFWWYHKTEKNNITNCWGWWDTLLITKDNNDIVLVYDFPDFPWIQSKYPFPKQEIEANPLSNTLYEQAKKYFNIDDTMISDQNCTPLLCNKIRYHVIETGDDLNDEIDVYTTQKNEENWGRWTLFFSDNFAITETDRGCANDWWCEHTGIWEYTNTDTIAYPLRWDLLRKQQFEIIEADETTLKIHRIYE